MPSRSRGRQLGADAALSRTVRTSRCSICQDPRRIAPSRAHPFGTDDRGRDVLVRLAYGFNVSLTFAMLVLLIGDGFGIVVGAMLGYFGGKLDLLGQRVIEIWSSLPFLYTIIISVRSSFPSISPAACRSSSRRSGC